MTTTARNISVGLIDASPDQNRSTFDSADLDRLAQSMRTGGLIVPVLLRRCGDRYVLIAGERRVRAARALGWATIRAEVTTAAEDDAAMATLAENLLRVDPDPIDEATGYRHAIDAYGVSAADLAHRVGVTPTRVRRRLKLLTLSAEVRDAVRVGLLPICRAEAMVGLDANRQHIALTEHPTLNPAKFSKRCGQLADDQAAEGTGPLFDADAFLTVETVETGSAVADAHLPQDQPLGPAEVAAGFGVAKSTVHQWQQRGRMVDPDLRVSGVPMWWPATIAEWAHETGRDWNGPGANVERRATPALRLAS